jgi:hypothetical protein
MDRREKRTSGTHEDLLDTKEKTKPKQEKTLMH